MYLRVAADIPKIEKSYWFTSDVEIKGHSQIRVGSIVRINLHGRRVRGWVCEIASDRPQVRDDESEFDVNKLKSIIEFVSDGPPPHLVAFCERLSKYYLSSPVTFLRACSPTRIQTGIQYSSPDFDGPKTKTKILVDPRADRREVIIENISTTGSTIIISPDSHERLIAWLQQANYKVVNYSDDATGSAETYRAATEKNIVIVGGRSTIFAPTSDCQSLIILDDAFEQLREERSPKWSALDVARIASDLWSVPLGVITSVPSVSTHEFEVKDIRNISKPWPKIKIENRNNTDPVLGVFTKKIVATINRSFKEGLDSAIVLNNTKSARMLVCSSCDIIATCENCEHAVYLDETQDHPLICPVCSTSRPSICLNCKVTTLKKIGKGLKSIANECQGIFPRHQVIEISKSFSEDEFESNDNLPKLYVATESLFHRPLLTSKLGNVIFLDIDSSIFRPSMNAFEQTLVLVNRALRAIKTSTIGSPIIVSTRAPENILIKDISHMDFVENHNREILLRRDLKLAPFYATAKIKSNTKAIEKYIAELPEEIISVVERSDADSIVYLTAKDHEELSTKSYVATRRLASKQRCIFSVDVYD